MNLVQGSKRPQGGKKIMSPNIDASLDLGHRGYKDRRCCNICSIFTLWRFSPCTRYLQGCRGSRPLYNGRYRPPVGFGAVMYSNISSCRRFDFRSASLWSTGFLALLRTSFSRHRRNEGGCAGRVSRLERACPEMHRVHASCNTSTPLSFGNRHAYRKQRAAR